MASVLILFLGVLIALILISATVSEDTLVVVLLDLSFVALAFLAVWPLGGDALGDSFAGIPTARGVGLGVALGLLVFVVNHTWLTGLGLLVGGESTSDPGPAPSFARMLLVVAVLPSLIEEWMCRGVLWVAVRRIADDRTALLSTALLFAFLHGLGGGQILELPSRFLLGLALGWLRMRTGSLVPCMAAHFANNVAACALPVGFE